MNTDLVKQILRGGWVSIILILIGLVFYFVTPLVYPFIIGWLIAYMLNPFINFLNQRAKLPRWLAVIVCLLLFIALIVTLVTLLIANIVVEAGILAQSLQVTIEQWKNSIIQYINSHEFQNIINNISRFYEDNPNYHNTINSNIASLTKSLADFSSVVITFFINLLISLLTSMPNIATVTLISLLASFFISKNWLALSRKVGSLFPTRVVETTRTIWRDLQHALFGYVRAQLILITLTAIIIIIGLMLIGVKYAITIGLLIGLVDLLPYFGVGAVMIPWLIYQFFQGDIYLGIGLTVLYGIVLTARSLLEPKVLASSVGLDPLATLIALYVGLKLFGVLGLIIGPVTLVLLFAFQRASVFRDLWHYVLRGPAKTG